ncbi:N/A [soil metagenome]
MRILLLLDSYEENEAGAIALRLCERWAPLREITLSSLAFGPDGPLSERLRTLGVGARRFPWRGLQDAMRVREYGKKMLYRPDRPDVIHSHCRWPELAARFFHFGNPNVPLLITVNYVPPKHRLVSVPARIAERMTRRWPSVFAASSRHIKNEMQRRGVNLEHLRLISMGVDAIQTFPLAESSRKKYRSLLAVDEAARVIVYTSDPDSSHAGDFPLVLRAMKRVLESHPSARLFAVGEFFANDATTNAVKQAGLEGKVRLIGRLSDTLNKVYSTADVVVRSVTPGAFPLGAAEALASGTPVIAMVDDCCGEFVREGAGGLRVADESAVLAHAELVPNSRVNQSETALADALLNLLGDNEARINLGSAAREAVLEKFEISATAEAYIKLWKELAPDASWKSTGSSTDPAIAAVGK